MKRVIDLRLVAVAVVFGAAVGFLCGPSVTSALLRWGYIESVIRCIQAPCPLEASPATARTVVASCVLVGAIGGAAVAAGTEAARRHLRVGRPALLRRR
ncbi:MAG TPA: hypothetical protein VK988_21525 [Acidimicrobiales bacterium]|nr:hypothetical protein [Acidimicrobiales bacterium]